MADQGQGERGTERRFAAASTPPLPGRLVAASVLACIGAWTYLWKLGVGSWQGDEAIYASAADRLLESGGAAASEIGHPPLAMLAFAAGQALAGDDLLGVRIVSALCGLAVAAVLCALVGRIAGWWVGLGAALAWVVLPHGLRTVGTGLDKLDRFGRIDAVAALPLVLCLYAGWRWIEGGARRWAIAAGAFAGFAAAAKLPFGLSMTVVAVAGFIAHRNQIRRSIADVTAMATASIVAMVVSYLPFGTSSWTRFWDMIEFQREHAAQGHPIRIGDTVHLTAPWWANFWFTWRDDGGPMTIALVVLAVSAVATRHPHRWGAAYLLLAAMLPAAVLATSPVALPHYRFVWLAPLFAVATMGGVSLWRRGGLQRAVAGLAGLVLVWSALEHGSAIATLERSGYAEAAARIGAAGMQDGTLVHRATRPIVEAYLPDALTVVSLPADVVILDETLLARFPDPGLEVALNELLATGGCQVEIDQLRVVFPTGNALECAALTRP